VPAYVIVDVDVKDPATYKEYREKAPATVTAAGGRYIVRGAEPAHLEQGWDVHRFVMLEFPSVAAAKAWYASPAYQKILPIRLKSTRSRMMVVEGLDPSKPLPT
jgi:uncharacterized protein (DUF1330 family)